MKFCIPGMPTGQTRTVLENDKLNDGGGDMCVFLFVLFLKQLFSNASIIII